MGVKKKKRQQALPFPLRLKSRVPKGIPFDTAQDKLTPVIPMKIGMSLAEKKARANQGLPDCLASPRGFEPLLPT